jgi:hypothetical protein
MASIGRHAVSFKESRRSGPGDRTACIVPPVRATRDQLTRFHDHAFIGELALAGVSSSSSSDESSESDSESRSELAVPRMASIGRQATRDQLTRFHDHAFIGELALFTRYVDFL